MYLEALNGPAAKPWTSMSSMTEVKSFLDVLQSHTGLSFGRFQLLPLLGKEMWYFPGDTEHFQPLGNCSQACAPDLKHCHVLQIKGDYPTMLFLLQKGFAFCVGYIQNLHRLQLFVQPYRLLLHMFSNYPTSVRTEGQQTILDKYFCHLVLDN